ncbi:hypothetical protein IW261DRAFT_1573450 [Armillaria novae-zelandiae]|uniref:Uncharacterized protein n=1 Tax=Armillaria novae-zelandiae TaxID=153914 RepID=A0AA39NN55_9AGAR|nr:hypothetical protein IW261DRAFT_1573450 [Armillaria novae-zelandiae]
MPYDFPNPRATANLPTAVKTFPYDKSTCSGEAPAMLPVGSAAPFTDGTFPRVYIPWNHITAGFPEEIQAKEDKKSRNREENRSRRSTFDKPWPLVITGFSEDFGKFLLWYQCFATASHSVWNLLPFNPKALAWTITAFQGNVVSDDPELIAEALACIKTAAWHDTSIQNLVKWITQSQGCSGNPAELTVMMTQSWRLSYIETKNLDDDKGPVFLLTGEPITYNLDLHQAIAAHIRKLRIHVNYQQLINVDKIIRCDWCKNQNHLSHACPFLEVDSTWYGPSTEELRLQMMKSDPPKDALRKRKEESKNADGRSKHGKKNDISWSKVRHGKKQ